MEINVINNKSYRTTELQKIRLIAEWNFFSHDKYTYLT